MEQFFTWFRNNVLTSPGLWIIVFFVVCGIYVHFRGRRKQSIVRQLFDHSTFMGPVNILKYLFSKVPTSPNLSTSAVPGIDLLKENWETIREEALALENANKIKSAAKYNDVGFNSFFRRGWKRFYLKWYGDYHKSAVDVCPKTIEIVKKIPAI